MNNKPLNLFPLSHEGCDAFWKYWKENGETHKHGYYESTWGAIRAYLEEAGSVTASGKTLKKLCEFYGVDSYTDLINAQDAHIERLQEQLPPLNAYVSLESVREG